MVTKMEEAAVALGDLGLSLVKLAKSEQEEGSCLGSYTHETAATASVAAEAKKTGTVSPSPL